jgi:elongation factor Ts|tara:strand:+ start:5035 stop:5541 length:507 start_codon:yes stop_codon:yes gene_type:complete
VAISIAKVKELREKTGVGVMDAKNALEEAGGDIANAEKILSEKGLASASKRSGRSTSEGSVVSYIHTGGRIGSMLEIKCETDFVAKTKEFAELGKNIAMQIAAMNPTYIDRDSIPEDSNNVEDHEILMEQEYIRDSSMIIRDLVNETISKTGENIRINRFVRYELGDQ